MVRWISLAPTLNVGCRRSTVSYANQVVSGSSPNHPGASFFRPSEVPLRYDIGVDKIMWGQDYPHIEGTYPYTTEALRNTFAGLDVAEVAPMVGLTAIDVYGFDLDVLEPVAAKVGPTVEEVAVPLEHVPADSHSIAFAGENLKPW